MKSKLTLISCALLATVACNSNNRPNRSVTDTTSGTTSSAGTTTTTTDTTKSTATDSTGMNTTNSKTAPDTTASESSIGKGTNGSNESMAAGADTNAAGTNAGTASAYHKKTKSSNLMHAKKHDLGSASKMIEGRDWAAINFTKGSAEISEASKAKLRSMINAARGNKDDNGRIDALHAAVWSDHAFPAAGKGDLSKADRDLADKRVEAIHNFFKNDLNLSDIKTYSMAEKSNWFARAFNTKDAELKSLFAQKGAPADVREDAFRTVKAHGGPSKAVILLDLKDHANANSAAIGTHTSRNRDNMVSTTTRRTTTDKTVSTSGTTTSATDHAANHNVKVAAPVHASAEGMHRPGRDTGADSKIPNSIDRTNNGDQGASTDSSRANLDDLSTSRQ